MGPGKIRIQLVEINRYETVWVVKRGLRYKGMRDQVTKAGALRRFGFRNEKARSRWSGQRQQCA